MHKKTIFILVIVTALTFFNSLFNEFVGDDSTLFIENDFYYSWSNYSQIFSPGDYLANQDAVYNNESDGINSGSVAYRPVLSTTYFFDYWIWKLNPFGYHLTNFLLHNINAILVYFVIFSIFKSTSTALLGALLFSIHPLKAEPVASIGYRGDILACFFILLSFLYYLKNNHEKKFSTFFLSHTFFFLALFSKESAVVYPGLLICFDWLVNNHRIRDIVKRIFTHYLGFILILVFYLFVYLKIFPNTVLYDGSSADLGSWQYQMVTIFRILGHYLSAFAFPFLVKSLPPLYIPRIDILWGTKTLVSISIFIFLIFILVKLYQRDKRKAFFLLWFFICLIPVSNIIPIANPMAYRFMYLPSVGLSLIGAICIFQVCLPLKKFAKYPYLSNIIKSGFIAACMTMTVFLNFTWKNNATMAYRIMLDFPNHANGYYRFATYLYELGMIKEAREVMEKGISLGLNDPRGYYLMGICYVNDLEKSKPYFEKSLMLFPKFAFAHTALGRIYLLQNNPDQALSYFEQAANFSSRYTIYGYLVQAHLLNKEPEKAKEIIRNAQPFLEEEYFEYLSRLYASIINNEIKIPIDLGI